VVWGDRDRIIPVKHAEALGRLIDGVEVTVLEGSGHYPHNEQPELFGRVVRRFLDDPRVSAAQFRAVPQGACATGRTDTTGLFASHGAASPI
jgi:hypothetical protein